MVRKLLKIAFALIFSSSFVFGSGFSIYEQGAKATAMGGAFIAQANNVSGVFYNPAGITTQEGFKIGLGTTIIMPSFAFQGPTNIDPNLYTKANEAVFPPATFYATYKISDDFSAGFGFYTLFGLGSDWDKTWPGRQLATVSEVQTFYFNPVIAYQIMDGLSIAAGFSAVYATVSLEKSVYYGIRDVMGESKLEANTVGYGFNVGLRYALNEKLSIGAVYRDNVMLKFEDGDAKFDFPTSANPIVNAEIGSLFPNTKGSADLELPNLMGFGVAYQFSDRLIAEFDWMQLGWSSYDELKLVFEKPVGGSYESVAERKYEDSYSLRFGLEYMVDKQLAVRLGFLRDNHAVPDARVEPSLPEGDRSLYSMGLGYTTGDLTIDGYYMLLTQDDRKITNSVDGFNGKYTGMGHLFGVSFEYGF
jgi:long-chain fatty acid transport protein